MTFLRKKEEQQANKYPLSLRWGIICGACSDVELTSGLEPPNLLITNEVLYRLSYVSIKTTDFNRQGNLTRNSI